MKITLPFKFAEYRKWFVAAVGLVAQIVAAGILTGEPLHIAQAILLVAALVGVRQVRQDPQAPKVQPPAPDTGTTAPPPAV